MRIVLEFNYQPDDLNDLGKLWWKTRPKKRGYSLGKGMIGWFLFIGLAVFLFVWLERAPKPASTVTVTPTGALVPKQPDPWAILLPVLPLLLVLALVWFFVFYALRRSGRRIYEANKLLQLLHTMVIDDVDGISESTSVTSSSWKWPALTAVFEQERAFALRVSESQSFVMIPKRAVPPEQMEALRRMLKEHIQPSTGAFPVVPIERGPMPVIVEPRSTPPPLPPME